LRAITVRAVRDGLKLDGLALLPLATPAAFGDHVAASPDRPALRAALLAELRRQPRQIAAVLSDRDTPDWLPADALDVAVAVAAIPFGVGTGGAVGALLGWREVKPRVADPIDPQELLVLKTLADYAAVALERAR